MNNKLDLTSINSKHTSLDLFVSPRSCTKKESLIKKIIKNKEELKEDKETELTLQECVAFVKEREKKQKHSSKSMIMRR